MYNIDEEIEKEVKQLKSDYNVKIKNAYNEGKRDEVITNETNKLDVLVKKADELGRNEALPKGEKIKRGVNKLLIKLTDKETWNKVKGGLITFNDEFNKFRDEYSKRAKKMQENSQVFNDDNPMGLNMFNPKAKKKVVKKKPKASDYHVQDGVAYPIVKPPEKIKPKKIKVVKESTIKDLIFGGASTPGLPFKKRGDN